jgi:hypothetical protein
MFFTMLADKLPPIELPMFDTMMIVLLLFLQKQNLATAIYLPSSSTIGRRMVSVHSKRKRLAGT